MTGLLAKRVIMGALSLVLAGIAFEAVRRRKLRERYAILWMLSALAVLLSALFPSIPDFVARKLGLTFTEGASYLFATLLVMVTFHISTALSRLRADQEAAARRLALLQAEQEKLRAEVASLKNKQSGT